MKKCELCNQTAKMYCQSDTASLCYTCDQTVHSANFLVAKHSRTLLCLKCQSPTPWTASGSNLGRTVTLCPSCDVSSSQLHQNDVVDENRDDLDDDDDDDDDEDDDVETSDEEDCQVVPWSECDVACGSGGGGLSSEDFESSRSGSKGDLIDSEGRMADCRLSHCPLVLQQEESNRICSKCLKFHTVKFCTSTTKKAMKPVQSNVCYHNCQD